MEPVRHLRQELPARSGGGTHMTGKILGTWLAGAFVLLLTGCAPSEISNFLFTAGSSPNGDRIIVGDLETVTAATQSSFAKLGIVATKSERDGSIYLNA